MCEKTALRMPSDYWMTIELVKDSIKITAANELSFILRQPGQVSWSTGCRLYP
jgi:hypothetical protein